MKVLIAPTPYISNCHMYLVYTFPISNRPLCGYCNQECGIHAISVPKDKVEGYKKLGFVEGGLQHGE